MRPTAAAGTAGAGRGRRATAAASPAREKRNERRVSVRACGLVQSSQRACVRVLGTSVWPKSFTSIYVRVYY